MSVTPGDAAAPTLERRGGRKTKALEQPETTPDLLGFQAERRPMSRWRLGWLFDAIGDLEREIVALGFLRRERQVKHMAGVVRFTLAPWQRIADQVVEAVEAGKTIAEAIPVMDLESRELVAAAIRDHQDQVTDWEDLDNAVMAHHYLAAILNTYFHQQAS